MPTAPFRLAPDDERKLAAALFNRVWELLGKSGRDSGDEDELIHAAHASRHHWGVVGEPVHWARGEWQCSRVYAVLGRAEPALYHARRCLDLGIRHGLGPFDIGVAHEAIARSHRAAGHDAQAAEHVALGRAQSAQVTDPADRAVLDADLDDLTSSPGPAGSA